VLTFVLLMFAGASTTTTGTLATVNVVVVEPLALPTLST
jgi:hypothetical protein